MGNSRAMSGIQSRISTSQQIIPYAGLAMEENQRSDPLWEDALEIVSKTQREISLTLGQVRLAPPQHRQALLVELRALQENHVYKNALALLDGSRADCTPEPLTPKNNLNWDCCSSYTSASRLLRSQERVNAIGIAV